MSQLAFDMFEECFKPPGQSRAEIEADRTRAERIVAHVLASCALDWIDDEFDIGYMTWAIRLHADGPFCLLGAEGSMRGDIPVDAVSWALRELVDEGKLIETRHYWGAKEPARKKGDPEYRGFTQSWTKPEAPK